MKALDIHGLNIDEAIKVIKKNIDLAYKNNETILYVNHCFNNGVLVSYCTGKYKKIKGPKLVQSDLTPHDCLGSFDIDFAQYTLENIQETI